MVLIEDEAKLCSVLLSYPAQKRYLLGRREGRMSVYATVQHEYGTGKNNVVKLTIIETFVVSSLLHFQVSMFG